MIATITAGDYKFLPLLTNEKDKLSRIALLSPTSTYKTTGETIIINIV